MEIDENIYVDKVRCPSCGKVEGVRFKVKRHNIICGECRSYYGKYDKRRK